MASLTLTTRRSCGASPTIVGTARGSSQADAGPGHLSEFIDGRIDECLDRVALCH
jgi:hypothetical protein